MPTMSKAMLANIKILQPPKIKIYTTIRHLLPYMIM